MNSTIRVLIVDDDEPVRESIAAFLEDDGFVVESVETAEAALCMLQSARYDVCITDFTLPGIDGEALILLCREVSMGTRFIMHSGLTFIPSDELLSSGFTLKDILSKPIMRLELLSGRIKELAGKKGVPE